MTESLLAGAVDLHRHGCPEISLASGPPRDDADDIRLCRQAGMHGVVLSRTYGRRSVVPTYWRSRYPT
jgi:hypothetical protein